MNHQKILDINRQLIQNDIIDQIRRVEPKVTKSRLAEVLDVSRSFISQLYSGNRNINLEHLAKIQAQLKLKIRIKFESAELIRIKNDPKRFSMHYYDNPKLNNKTTNLESKEAFSYQA